MKNSVQFCRELCRFVIIGLIGPGLNVSAQVAPLSENFISTEAPPVQASEDRYPTLKLVQTNRIALVASNISPQNERAGAKAQKSIPGREVQNVESGSTIRGRIAKGNLNPIAAVQSRVNPAEKHPGKENPKLKANWNIGAGSVSGTTSITVWWDAQPGQTYTVCWKEMKKFGFVCWYNHPFEVYAGASNFYSGVQYAGIHNLKCDTDYKVRVKLGLSADSTPVTTAACGCSDPCPKGGWYDGANCQIGQAPSGTEAFIWNGGYYYSPLPGNLCPYPDSSFDGANCYLHPVPSGVKPFIHENHWYYKACP